MRKQISRVGKDLLKIILLVSCRIKTINRIQFFWWLSSVLFWSLTPGSVLAHLPPSVHPSYYASSLCLPFTEGLPCIWVVHFSQKSGVLGQEKNCSPLFLPPSVIFCWGGGKVSQLEGNWVPSGCLVDGVTEVVRVKGRGKQLFHFWLELRCAGSSSHNVRRWISKEDTSFSESHRVLDIASP